jgi:enamine deaminase RidA (YjgF/YER057c/UK114 family)
MHIEERLAARGLVLPAPMEIPAGMALPFPWVRLWPAHLPGRAFVSGHGPLLPDGSIPKSLLGKVGADVSETDAYEAARLTGLAIIASLQRALGDLDRVTGWLRVFGMVNAAPGFTRTPAVINGFSDLILDLWGPEGGAHARSAIGVAELPLGIPVEIEAEVAIDLPVQRRPKAPQRLDQLALLIRQVRQQRVGQQVHRGP